MKPNLLQLCLGILTLPVALFAVTGTGTGLRGTYYANVELAGSPALTRTDGTVNFDWQQAGPGTPLPGDRFSARWTGQMEAPVSGAYTFATLSDDGVRLWVDGKLLIDNWTLHPPTRNSTAPQMFVAGKKYDIKLEYYENAGGATMKLYWAYTGQPEQVIPQARLFLPADTSTPPVTPPPSTATKVWLSDLPWIWATNGLGPVERDLSNGAQAAKDGKPLTINGQKFAKGLGVHARSEIRYNLDDRYKKFKAVLGIDDQIAADKGSAVFQVWLDGVKVYESPVIKGNMAGVPIDIPLVDKRELRLIVLNGGDGSGDDHADWADACFEGIDPVTYVSDLSFTTVVNGWGPPEKDRSNGETGAADGKPLTLDGQVFKKGLGVHAKSEIKVALAAKYELFSTIIGLDDETNNRGSVVFEVWTDGQRRYESPILKGDTRPRHVVVDVKGKNELLLRVLDGGDGGSYDHADWADAKLLPLGAVTPPPTTPPAAPTNVSATPGATSILIGWNLVPGAASYKVFRGTSANGQSTTPVGSPTANTFTDTTVTSGAMYFYKVQAVNAAGSSPMSGEVSASPVPMPGTPTNLTATPGNAQVVLSWTGVGGASGYRIYRGTSAGFTSTTPIQTVNTTSFTNTGLTNGTKYYYRVSAISGAAEGPKSNEASATPQIVLPAPTSVSATPGNAQVVIAWQAVPNATGYRIYRGATAGFTPGTPHKTTSGLTVTDPGLTNGTAYFYRVAAVAGSAEGTRSAEVTATPVAPPVAPTNVSGVNGDQQVTLTWTAVAGATSYSIYRGTAANAQASTPIATGVTAPTFVNTGLVNGTSYFYKVTARNAGGESPRSAEVRLTPQGPPPPPDPATISAFRFLRQATWGPKPGDVNALKASSKAAFLDVQFAQLPSTFSDGLYEMPVEAFQEDFIRLAIQGNDQLRQRVAWALSQILVVSAVQLDCNEAMLNYYRILQNNAFGNYRTLMGEITVNPAMGAYLNMLNSKSESLTGTPPNENYARELLQLFTTGIPRLNPDGSPAGGDNYTEEDVKELSRIFTGWTFGDGNLATVPTAAGRENYKVPMEPVAAFHDTGAKTFLGANFPPGQSARQDMNQALDVIFNHPSVGPYICRQLIQRLVTSNPSPAYLSSVVAVFNNNGGGVRGDLRAVVRAILLHPEAELGTATAGKLSEPTIFMVSILRALNASVVDHPFVTDIGAEMGQKVFYSPSVFNYYSPFFRVRGTNLFGPEFQIFTSTTSLAKVNFVGRLISGGFGSDVAIDYSPFTNIAADAAGLVDFANTQLLGGLMSPQQRQTIINAVAATPASNPTERVRTCLYLILASAQFQVER